ncbi:Geranylgeranyl transferase type-1 subunit beta [Paramyrothecium foliicola]|nr:Geranylgeranyl transferase type-1 subunit beta [Paramyrothecium foliicola]
MAADAERPGAVLEKERHIKYWQRCFSSFLPSAYTSADSTRLTFASFIVCAQDLLSVSLSAKDRAAIRAWVLSLQHPDGGFCGSPTHALSGQAAVRGTPNLAATFFALTLLGLAAEGDGRHGFRGVRRTSLLKWLRALQREDGSFGQILWEGRPVLGRDTRHSYLASSIRWMLRGWEGDGLDFDVERLISCVREGQTYDGGLSETSQNESHAGYTFCGVAALAMLDRQTSASPHDASSAISRGIADRQGLLRFLALRQFAHLQDKEDEADDDDENFIEAKLGDDHLAEGRCRHVGFNGRCNKKADTCYCWWVGGALVLLGESDLINKPPARNFIAEITQHRIGGFSKLPGAPPDVFHSYLGLAALAMMGEPSLKELDVGLCCSKDITARIAKAGEGLLEDTA